MLSRIFRSTHDSHGTLGGFLSVISPAPSASSGCRLRIYAQPRGIGTGSGSRGGGRFDGGREVVVVEDDGGGPSSSGSADSARDGGAVVDVVGFAFPGGTLALGLGAGAHSGPPGGSPSGSRAGGTSKPSRSLSRFSAATFALASNSARLGRGAAAVNGRGSTSFTASAMKSCQIIDGRLPPTTWGTPWTLAMVVLPCG